MPAKQEMWLDEAELKDLEDYSGATRRIHAIRAATHEIRVKRELLKEVILDVATCDMSGDLRRRILNSLSMTEEQVFQEREERQKKSTEGS